MQTGAQRHKNRINRFIPAQERKAYCIPSPWRSAFTFTHIWTALSASFGLVWLLQLGPLPLQILAAPCLIVFIGSRINALAVQIHEAAHGLLAANRAANHWWGNLAAAYWIMNDVEAYWRLHREHHAHLHDDNDPDLGLYCIPGLPGPALRRLLLHDLVGITAVERIANYIKHNSMARLPHVGHALGKLAAQSTLLALFAAVFGLPKGLVLYTVYWLIPLFSIFPLIIRVRTVTEHYSEHLNREGPAIFVSRTSISNVIEEYLIGAQMEYHLEHHVFPRMPFHQLKRFHRELVRRGFFDEAITTANTTLSGGYLRFWRTLLFNNKANQTAARAA